MLKRKNNTFSPFLSVIVPAYQQEKTIYKDILQIDKTFKELNYKYEIIVVNDGSTDRTYKELLKLKSKKIKIVSYERNQGKGHAVRYGMIQAKGDIIGFIDSGMDINPNGFEMLLQHMQWYDADIIIGSKMHPVSKVDYPIHRKVLSWGYRFLTRRLFGFQVKDTQVGLKFFKKKVVMDVLPRLLVKQYAFDIEILAVAYRLGYKRIYEAPVEINFRNNTITTWNVWKTIFLMLKDTIAVFYRLKILHYYDKNVGKSVISKIQYTMTE